MISKEYLDDERKKIWSEVLSVKEEMEFLKQEVNKKTSDYEDSAKQASKKTSEYRNRSLEAKDSAQSALTEILETKQSIEVIKLELNNSLEKLSSIVKTGDNARHKFEAFEQSSSDIEALFSKHDSYVETIDQIEQSCQKSEELSTKINLLYTDISKKRKSIDEAYTEVFGYEEDDEDTGEIKTISGSKAELETSYNEIKVELNQTKEQLSELLQTTEEENSKFLHTQGEKISSRLSEWDSEYLTTSSKIKSLLPDALTAGLSHAFSTKRAEEITSGEKLNKVFNWSLVGLAFVSLIPFAVNAYHLNIGKSLEEVIVDMPRLLTSIIPLYIPLVWLAYSSNKKANLSKRLVEEYTHKEVLSKTFEGLSSQIESIAEQDISKELRIKLLYNLLDVSAENPGKLISDYNTSDHPVIDALEKSSKLAESIDKLENIPGMTKISKLMDEKSKKHIEDQSKKITTALESVES